MYVCKCSVFLLSMDVEVSESEFNPMKRHLSRTQATLAENVKAEPEAVQKQMNSLVDGIATSLPPQAHRQFSQKKICCRGSPECGLGHDPFP